MTTPTSEVSLDDILSSPPTAPSAAQPTSPTTSTSERPATVQRTSSVRLVSSPVPDALVDSTSRDSLQNTREYYGLSPIPIAGPSNPQRSSSTRQSHRRTLSNATSRRSSASRPTSPEPKRPTSTVPLPLHKGFFSPKKPKAAIQLEEKQRQASLRLSAKDQSPIEGDGAGEPVVRAKSPATHAEAKNGRISEEAGASLASHAEGSTIGTGTGAGIGDIFPSGTKANHALADGYSGPTFDRPSKAPQQSLAETSPCPGTQAEESSDHLVPDEDDIHDANSRSRGKSNGHDIEKGRIRNGYPPSPPRPTIQKRFSSHRSKVDGKTKDRDGPSRRYESFENPLSTFLCKGYFMTGGDNPWSVLLVIVLLFGITGVWFGTTGVWYWRNAGDYGMARGSGVAIDIIFVYLFGLTLSSFLAASLREPGIIPRDLDPEPPMSHGETDSWYQPLDREFAVRQGRVVVRYCETCRSYRPPRASHCRLCGNCVDGIDHHCSYLHTCVGKRTYLSFFTLLVTAGIAAVYIVIFSAIHFSLLCHVDSIGFGTAIQQSPGAAVSFLLGLLVLPGIIFLLVYHFRLLIYNLTTVEQIRASASKNLLKANKRPDNPFAADSIFANILLSTLARPQFPSWVQAWKVVEPERRTVNPALTDERWVKIGFDKGMR